MRTHTESPGFNAGRGLKPVRMSMTAAAAPESPGFNAGRGLKHSFNRRLGINLLSRPVLMPGVD